MQVCVHISGCDDSTSFFISVDESGLALLRQLEKRSNEMSNTICMPTLVVVTDPTSWEWDYAAREEAYARETRVKEREGVVSATETGIVP